MHRGLTAGEVTVQAVAVERGHGSHEQGHGGEALVQGLVGGQLVGGHRAAPEAFAVQANEPVAQVAVHKVADGTGGAGGLIVLKVGLYLGNEGIEGRDDPAVYLGTLGQGHLGRRGVKAVHVGIQGKERVGVVQGAEELAGHLGHTSLVKLEVVPGRRVADHVPAQRVAAIGLDGAKRVNGVAQALAHLVTVLVEHQTVGNHVLVGHAVKHHRRDGMQREEPAARLVHALGNEVGGEECAVVNGLLVLERVVQLGIGHRTAVKPHVDQVELALHGLASVAHQHDVVHVGAVDVNLVIILLAVVTGDKALVLVGVARHHAGSHGLLNLVIEFLDAADALLLAVLVAPDGQRGAPVAAAAQVPVVQVLQPFAKAAAARVLGLPVDGAVELNHAVAAGRVADKPAVQRVVEHGLVGAPAVRIVVGVLLHLEGGALLLHADADVDVQVLGLGGCRLVILAVHRVLRVIGILDPAAGILLVQLLVDKLLDEVLVEVVEHIVFAGEIDHGSRLHLLVDHVQGGDAGGLGHAGIVGTKGGRDVHDSRTVLGGHIVTGDDAEAAIIAHDLAVHLIDRLYPREELLIAHLQQVLAFEAGDDLIGHYLVASAVLQRLVLAVGLEVGIDARLGQQIDGRLARVGVETLHGHIIDLASHTQGGVAGQCPRGGRPCQHIGIVKPGVGLFTYLLDYGVLVTTQHSELGRHGLVLDVAVAARQVQLVRAQAGAGSGRVGLDGVALVEQALVIELLEQPPQALDVAVLVGDIGVLHIDPVAHAVGQVFPLAGVFHHLLAAGGIVLIDGDLLADILLGDTQGLLHAQLHGQAVSVPAGLAQHLVALHRLEAAEDVLDGPGHHMVDARHAIGTGRTLKEHIRLGAIALADAAAEHVFLVPLLQHFLIDIRQIKPVILVEFFHFLIMYDVKFGCKGSYFYWIEEKRTRKHRVTAPKLSSS